MIAAGLLAFWRNEPNFIMFIQLLGSSIACIEAALGAMNAHAEGTWRRGDSSRMRCACGRNTSQRVAFDAPETLIRLGSPLLTESTSPDPAPNSSSNHIADCD
jgi:hypothetical protein